MTDLGLGSALGEDGRYRLEGLLGTGGMASVWRATDTRLGRTVAVKLLSDLLALDEAYVRRFAREGRIAAGLSHPHLVSVYDVGAHQRQPFIVMEHVPGGTLAQRLGGSRADWDAVILARELISAVGYIHGAGIIHRDIKPANVLIDADGRARLSDFGIAQPTGATQLTQVGKVIGTQKYLAPELLDGRPATTASDMYSLGVLLGECARAAPAPELRRLTAAMTDLDPLSRPRSAADALGLLALPVRRSPTADPQPADTVPAETRPVDTVPADPVSAETRRDDTRPADTVAVPGPTAATRRRVAPKPTAATRVQRPGAATQPTGQMGAGPSRLAPAARRWLAAAALLLIAVLVLVLLAGGSSSPPRLTPTPSRASVSQQLSSLDQAIDHAQR